MSHTPHEPIENDKMLNVEKGPSVCLGHNLEYPYWSNIALLLILISFKISFTDTAAYTPNHYELVKGPRRPFLSLLPFPNCTRVGEKPQTK